VFGLFFALITVCAVRGLALHLHFRFRRRADAVEPALACAPAGSVVKGG